MNVFEAAVILGISKDSTDQDLRRSWRKLAMLHHPDRNKGDEVRAAEKFTIVSRAFEILSTGGMQILRAGNYFSSGRQQVAQPIMISGPYVPRRRRTRVNPMYWEEQAWLEQEFGHLGSWGRNGKKRF